MGSSGAITSVLQQPACHTHTWGATRAAGPPPAPGAPPGCSARTGCGRGWQWERREQEQASEGEAVSPGAVPWPPLPAHSQGLAPAHASRLPSLLWVPQLWPPAPHLLPVRTRWAAVAGGAGPWGRGAWAAESLHHWKEGPGLGSLVPRVPGWSALGQRRWSWTQASLGSCLLLGHEVGHCLWCLLWRALTTGLPGHPLRPSCSPALAHPVPRPLSSWWTLQAGSGHWDPVQGKYRDLGPEP